MDIRIAKEYLHIRDWLTLAQEIVDAGESFANLRDATGWGRPQEI
jgi:hypothetical protein